MAPIVLAAAALLAAGSAAGATSSPAAKTFKPIRAWTWVETTPDGERYATTLRIGGFTRLGDVAPLPGISIKTLKAQCPIDSNADVLAPVELTMTNQTPALGADLSTNIRRMDETYGTATDLWVVAGSGGSIGCYQLASETTGGQSWTVDWGTTAPRRTTPPSYAYLIIHGYYGPGHRAGDPSLVRKAILELDYGRYNPPRTIVALTGPGVKRAQGSPDLFLPLLGLTGKLPCAFRDDQSFSGQWKCGG